MLEYKILIKLLCTELRVHMLCKVTPPPLESCLDFLYMSRLKHLSFQEALNKI